MSTGQRHLLRKATAVSIAGAIAVFGIVASATPSAAQEPDSTITGVTSPQGLAVDSSGDLYVAGSRGTTISVVEAGDSTPNPSLEVTGLSRPRGVAFDSAGLLYVANTGTSSVLVYDVTASRSVPIRTLTGVSTPFGVAVDSEGTVFATSGLDTTVMVFDAGSTTPNPAKTLTGLTKANGVAVDANDNVYVSNQNGTTVQVFDRGATTSDDSKTLTGLNNPQGIAISPSGKIYVSSGYAENVLVYNPDQTVADPALTLTGFTAPLGVAITSSATIFVGNAAVTDNILVFNPVTPPTPGFECTEAPQSYVVPDWATRVNVSLSGAQGGGSAGGQGGKTTSLVSVTPGSTIQVNVGCEPASGTPQTGGFNGGANAGAAGGSSGTHLGAYFGGGGASDIRIGDCAATLSCTAADRVVVAGGGGGGELRGGKARRGGAGGGPTAGNGTNDAGVGVGAPGKGASNTAGGSGGKAATLSQGSKGSTGTVGAGGNGGASAATSASGPGAGGGGGLYGGGGGGAGDHVTGSGIGGAGGGGSSGVGPAGTAIAAATTYNNGSVTGDGSVSITPVQTPLIVTTQSLADGTETVGYSQQLKASGGVPAYTWALATGSSLAGTGLILSPGGELQGTPPASSSGTYTFTVEVTDSDSHTATKELTLVIDTGIAVTTSSLADGSESAAYSQTLTSSGGGGATAWAIDSGSLPPGLSLDAATGEISGTPTAADTFNFVVEVTGTDTSTALAPLSLTITDELAVSTTSPLPPGVLDSAYALQLAAVGGIGPNTWDSTGTLPTGLSISSTGLLSGTPTSSGTFSFTAEVTDSLTTTASAPMNITINPALEITTTTLPPGNVDTAYDQTLNATGGLAPDSWGLASGALPTGLSIEQHTGEIVGTPATVGTFDFTVEATDSLGTSVTQELSIAIGAAPTPSNLPQTAAQACITKPTSLPKRGQRKLMKPGCVTNAGQRVAVTVSAKRRGDVRYFTLRCTSGNKTAKPKSTATGSKYCTSGALRIRTHGKKLRISVAWSAPATTGYDALAQSKTYRT